MGDDGRRTKREVWMWVFFALSLLFGLLWGVAATYSREFELDRYIASIQQADVPASTAMDLYKTMARLENIGFRLWSVSLGAIAALAAFDVRRFFAQEIEWESRETPQDETVGG